MTSIIHSNTLKNSATLNCDGKTTIVEADRKENLNGYNLVRLLKNTYDKRLFHNDFDTWTIEEQYNWVDKNLSKFYPNVPETLLGYIPASFRQLDRSSLKVPEWLDLDKYRRGQKFVRENYVPIIITKLIGLIHVYSFNDALKPVIIGRRGHTPFLGFERYQSVIKRIFNWYNGEPWIKGSQAYKDMQIAHKMHLMMGRKLCQDDNEQIDTMSKIAEPWCPDREILLKDFAMACPFKKLDQQPFIMMSESPYRPKGINNMDLAMVQGAFVGMILLRPRDIGVHNAIDKDIEAFCHMWRCYGYYLGLEDEYNFCRGTLKEIKQRTRDYYQYWITSNLKNITPEWEHMTKCSIEPMNFYPFIYMPYKTMVLIASDLLDLNMPHLHASLSFSEWIAYKVYKFILQHALKLSIVRYFFNKFVIRILKKAANYDSEKKAELQEKSKKLLHESITVSEYFNN
ncbi:uncharacterized protein LOC105249660 [Camponotus floridanus]|uniref:uncharacterized protein LOC105249660 n=1 Tax=Camponotus floridanus TaxID=104421 RepID=UPI00059CBABB|nr:uncharacterized protein LOC105249660 [Camponotus floridanus]